MVTWSRLPSQLLTLLDGVDELNNVLLVGMTNRRDLIDSALLRPGRLEVECELAAPDLAGRLQILRIHAAKLRLAANVSLVATAEHTPSFTGAELAGLLRSAASFALQRALGELDTDSEELLLAAEDVELRDGDLAKVRHAKTATLLFS